MAPKSEGGTSFPRTLQPGLLCFGIFWRWKQPPLFTLLGYE